MCVCFMNDLLHLCAFKIKISRKYGKNVGFGGSIW